MPIFLKRLVVMVRAHIDQASWQLLLTATLVHMAVTWGLLWLADESALLPLNTFFYYYVSPLRRWATVISVRQQNGGDGCCHCANPIWISVIRCVAG